MIFDVKFNTVKDIIDFVNLSNKFKSDINVCAGRQYRDGKSIQGMLSVGRCSRMKVQMVSEDKEEYLSFRSRCKKWEINEN